MEIRDVGGLRCGALCFCLVSMLRFGVLNGFDLEICKVGGLRCGVL